MNKKQSVRKEEEEGIEWRGEWGVEKQRDRGDSEQPRSIKVSVKTSDFTFRDLIAIKATHSYEHKDGTSNLEWNTFWHGNHGIKLLLDHHRLSIISHANVMQQSHSPPLSRRYAMPCAPMSSHPRIYAILKSHLIRNPNINPNSPRPVDSRTPSLDPPGS